MGEITVQLRGLNEAIYCERLFHMMYAQGIFIDNSDTLEGKMNHSIREKNGRNAKLEELNVYDFVLSGLDGKLSAKLDGIVKEGNEYIPIEDKNSKCPDREFECTLWGIKIKSSVWTNDFPQIVGQMYLLRKNGYQCHKGKIFYRASNRMIEIEYREEYDQLIENGVEHCLSLLIGKEPGPLIDSEKCIRCSLNWACLPDEINYSKKKIEEPRRLYPGRPDTSILYVTAQGGKVGKSGESLIVYLPTGENNTVPSKDVEDICIYGNVQITTQAIRSIVKNGGSIFYYSSGGWLDAVTTPVITKNVFMRIAQFERFKDEGFCINTIRNVILAKVSNQRTFLRRNRKCDVEACLNQLSICKKKINAEDNVDSIRGYEGNAAKSYWSAYGSLFVESDIWKINGRSKRPPKDEINAMLSYGYSLLLRDMISALTQCGLDYLYGFYHSIVPGRPALALDLMEPYRPIIVDSLVLRMVNENIVKKEQFVRKENGVYMFPDVKKKLIYMYEKRMDEMVTHPEFGYRLSYRRMMHLEAKLFGKYLTGELNDYKPLVTR